MKTCIYCENKTKKYPHFQSECCGRGMCDECYDSLQGTEEQIQIDYMDDEDYNRLIKGTIAERKSYTYICMDDKCIAKILKTRK